MRASLISVINETTHVQTFRFRPEQPIDYIAGQFAELTLEHDSPDERGARRWFTLSSSPSEGSLAITVNFAGSQSSFKRRLQQLKPGDKVQFGEVLGDFVLPLDTSIPLVWVAGGIGITPFRSMAQSMSDNNEQRTIHLFHSLQQPGDALFGDILSAAGISGLHVVDTSKQPRLDTQMLFDSLPANSLDDALFYISGPEDMVAGLRSSLQKKNISHQRIVTDTFLGYS